MPKFSQILACILCFATLLAAPLQVAHAYCSEEHKLVADIAASQVRVPPTVLLPKGVEFKVDPNYMKTFSAAKNLSVGFATNDISDYNKNKRQVQDNYYYNGFRQSTFNLKLWIPPASLAPSRVLYIPTQVGPTPTQFSFGELVSFYGDYRRTVYAPPSGGVCYLSNSDVASLHFARGNGAYGVYAPPPMPAAEYLRYIASGLVPPFGSLGNATSYTAKKDEFNEAGWWGDEMMRVAAINDWHFASMAIAWYVGLHRLALLYVNKARSNPAHWVTALHYEASALHSLTDLFSFGHIVVNRDRTSYQTIKRGGELNSSPIAWMSNVIAMGGARRNNEGLLTLSNALPPISDWPTTRYNTLKWKVNVLADLKSADENKFHDKFNSSGARVRNLNGDVFQIYGDQKMRDNPEQTQAVIIRTVRESLQSLVDSYLLLQQGRTPDQIGMEGSSFFRALKYIPVFVEQDPDNLFHQKWTWYARYAELLTGMRKLPENWHQCTIPYIDGITGLPKSSELVNQGLKVLSAKVTPESGGMGGTYSLEVEYVIAGLGDNEKAQIEETAMLTGPENLKPVTNLRIISRADGRLTKIWKVSPRKPGTYTFHYSLGHKCVKKTGDCFFTVGQGQTSPQGDYWVRTDPELSPMDPSFYTCPASIGQVTASDGSLALRQEVYHKSTRQLLGATDFRVAFSYPPERFKFGQDCPLDVEVAKIRSVGTTTASIMAQFGRGSYVRNKSEEFHMFCNAASGSGAGVANSQPGEKPRVTMIFSHTKGDLARPILKKRFKIELSVTTSGGVYTKPNESPVPTYCRNPGFRISWTYLPSGVSSAPGPGTEAVPPGTIYTAPPPNTVASNVVYPSTDGILPAAFDEGGSDPTTRAGDALPSPAPNINSNQKPLTPPAAPPAFSKSAKIPPLAANSNTTNTNGYVLSTEASKNSQNNLSASFNKNATDTTTDTGRNSVSSSESETQIVDSSSEKASAATSGPIVFAQPTNSNATANANTNSETANSTSTDSASIASAFPQDASHWSSANNATLAPATTIPKSTISALTIPATQISPARDLNAVTAVQELFLQQQFALRQLSYDFYSRRFSRITDAEQAELAKTMRRELDQQKAKRGDELREKENALKSAGYRIGSARLAQIQNSWSAELALDKKYRQICDQADQALAQKTPELIAIERKNPKLARELTFEFLRQLASWTKKQLYSLNEQRASNDRRLIEACRKVAASKGFDHIGISILGEGPDLDDEILRELQ